MDIPLFKESHLEAIAKAMADAVTHAQLHTLLSQCGIDEQGGSPKWERMLLALSARQNTDRCGNNVVAFIQAVLDPVRFVGRPNQHSAFCEDINRILSFYAIKLRDDGVLATLTNFCPLNPGQSIISTCAQLFLYVLAPSPIYSAPMLNLP